MNTPIVLWLGSPVKINVEESSKGFSKDNVVVFISQVLLTSDILPSTLLQRYALISISLGASIDLQAGYLSGIYK